jgi:hypothetical protein
MIISKFIANEDAVRQPNLRWRFGMRIRWTKGFYFNENQSISFIDNEGCTYERDKIWDCFIVYKKGKEFGGFSLNYMESFEDDN